jgi:hypothetical protein
MPCFRYGFPFISFINEKEGNVEVLFVEGEKIKSRCVCNLYSPGKYAVSVVDNLLVVHNMKAKVLFRSL